LIAGVRQFNDGQYFECHETLEALWKRESRPLREMYQGVLQIGVALHHLERGNQRGALRLLERGLNHLRWFSPACQGVDVNRLIAEAESLARWVAAQPEAVSAEELARTLLPRVRMMGARSGGSG